jgi:peptide/nickel transport system substrate-binding protein
VNYLGLNNSIEEVKDMKKKLVWLAVSLLMVLSLVIASCGQAVEEEEEEEEEGEVVITEEEQEQEEEEEEEAVSSDMPRYGGTLILTSPGDISYFDPMDIVMGGITLDLTHQRLWDGDWAKGIAGGYGTKETDWMSSYDVRAHKIGYVAETITFEVDNEKNEGHIIYTIREGVNFALNPDSPASRLVNGRDITADDVLFSLNRVITDPQANIYRANPALRRAVITKTGPGEVTVTVPIANLLEAGKRFGDSTFPVPQDVIKQFGNMRDWRNSVGTGPFILKDYVVGSVATLVRNPDYWLKDPVGPGKDNDLPYVDEVKWLIIPDSSTRFAAFRTGKIDQLTDVSYESAVQLEPTAPGAVKATLANITVRPIYMRTDKEPFSDIRVRQAMMMATDFVTIERDLYNNTGNILTWPYDYSMAYKDLYLSLDAPDCPASIKELYVYNPEKAKELLNQAGYPNGFKAQLDLTAAEADYYSIIKDQWAKAGIDLQLNVLEAGTHLNENLARSHTQLITSATGPPSIWPMISVLQGTAWQNSSMIDDPVVNEAIAKQQTLAITDEKAAMGVTRELMKYVLDQAWVIPCPSYPNYNFYWPWVRNYSGERSLGYFWVNSWTQFVWIDQTLKTSLGY